MCVGGGALRQVRNVSGGTIKAASKTTFVDVDETRVYQASHQARVAAINTQTEPLIYVGDGWQDCHIKNHLEKLILELSRPQTNLI